MPSTAQQSVLCVGLLLPAGCAGSFGGMGSTQSPNGTVDAEPTAGPVETDAATVSAGSSASIAVVNERPVPYRVHMYVLSEANPELTVTDGNGSTVTRSVTEDDSLVQGVPFVHWRSSSVERIRNVSSIEPTDADRVATWPFVVHSESTARLPRPIESHNVTLLVVIETTVRDQSAVYTATMERCEPPHPELTEFRVYLAEDRNSIRVSSRCS